MSAGAGEDVGEGSSVGEKELCSYCGTPCAKRLSSGCLSARYCGDKCQQEDWKQGHGAACPKDRCLEPSKQPAPAEPRDGAPSQLDKDDGPAAGPSEHDPADLEALPGDDLAQRDKEGPPGQLDESKTRLQRSLRPASQSWVNNDEPLYEGTYREILQARAHRKHDGSDEEDLARALSLIRAGQRARDRGEHDDAMGSLVRALEISMDVGEVLSSLAAAYQKQGKHPQMLEALNERLHVRKLGRKHPKVLDSQRDIARLRKVQERLSKELEMHQSVVKFGKEMHGNDHPDVGKALSKIGAVFEQQGKYLEAKESFKESLRIIRTLGEERVDVGSILNNLGVVAFKSGGDDEALQHFEEALKVLSTAPDSDDAMILYKISTVHVNIATVHKKKGSYKTAKEHFGVAVKLLTRVRGPGHSETKNVMSEALECASLS